MADVCAVSNPRFDRVKFLLACGVGDYDGEGHIAGRDVDSELSEVLDHRTNKKWVVPFADASDITNNIYKN